MSEDSHEGLHDFVVEDMQTGLQTHYETADALVTHQHASRRTGKGLGSRLGAGILTLLAVTGGNWIKNHSLSTPIPTFPTNQTTESGNPVLTHTYTFAELAREGYSEDRIQSAPDGHSLLIFAHNTSGKETLFAGVDRDHLTKIVTGIYEAAWYSETIAGQDPLFAANYIDAHGVNKLALFKLLSTGWKNVAERPSVGSLYDENKNPRFSWAQHTTEKGITEVEFILAIPVVVGNGEVSNLALTLQAEL